MNGTNKEVYLKRMNILIGHLNGVKKMIEEDKYCIDVLKQNHAVCESIKKLNSLILENHLKTCVMKAIKGDKESARKQKLDELMKVYNLYNK